MGAAGRPVDKVWTLYAKSNTDAATKAKKPYVDIFQGKPFNNATKFKLFLAFDCKKFKESKPKEWLDLVAGLSDDNVKTRKAEDRTTHRQCVAAAQKNPVGHGGSNGTTSHLGSRTLRAGAFGGSIAASGLSAAKKRLKDQGAQFMSKFVDSVSEPELEALRALQLRWLTGKGLPLSACDGELFDEFIEALRPACKGKLLNYDKIRCEALGCLCTRRTSRGSGGELTDSCLRTGATTC